MKLICSFWDDLVPNFFFVFFWKSIRGNCFKKNLEFRKNLPSEWVETFFFGHHLNLGWIFLHPNQITWEFLQENTHFWQTVYLGGGEYFNDKDYSHCD